jgi:aminoglycoside phosphotransferase (APT) family kinase protein
MAQRRTNMSDAALQALGAWLPAQSTTLTLSSLGAGFINDTWLVSLPVERFVLQRINPMVFPEPRQVAAKVARVVAHIRRGGGIRVPRLQPARNGAEWHENAEGVWRLWEYVADGRTLQQLTRPEQARAAGGAFGRFQVALADLGDPGPDPIVGFMQLDHYLDELDQAVTASQRAALDGGVEAALQAVAARADMAGLFQGRNAVVHGDCKINNLLFRADSDDVLCVLDLDTVMRGHWAWDFGDLVRSAAVAGGAFSLELYRAAVQGFLGSGAGTWDAQALLLAPRYVALMLGVRFLTDHLRGDRYFKVDARGDNLRRAVEQFELLQDMERQESAARAVLRRVAAKNC